jgi:cysteine desulfurase/selenocysteine lyase
MIDIQRVRKETPSCEDLVFLNSAGSSLMPKPVLETMTAFQLLEAQIGGLCCRCTKS